MNWKHDLAQAMEDIQGFNTHEDTARLVAGLQTAKIIASQQILQGDVITSQRVLVEIEETIRRTKYWGAPLRREFLTLYSLEFVPHHRMVEDMVSLPKEVDERVVRGFETNPEQFHEKKVGTYFAALINRKRHPLIAKLMDLMLDQAVPQCRGQRSTAHMLPEFNHGIDWGSLNKDKKRLYMQVYGKHEQKIVAAIAQSNETELKQNWSGIFQSYLIAALYAHGVNTLAEQMFQLHLKHHASDVLIAEMIAINKLPDREACQQNAAWAVEQKNGTYLLGLIELHLATKGQFPLLVDPGNKILEAHGARMGAMIRDHGDQSPALAGEIAVRFLEGCSGATHFFAKPLPKAVVNRHPSLLEGSLQADLGL
ncbi:hypothetical protein [Pseudomonas sp. S1(2024)]|uniref:hypothetical protein n=1 Tax=Pseudomonas sp. S1(2024) TaxID=3390191 RepID=UPI00397C89B8